MKKLYQHQQRALDKLPPEGGYLAFEQGLGKTLTAIAFCNKHDYYKTLVIAPSIAIGVWERELCEENQDILLPEGTRKEKAAQIAKAGREFIVINYEVLLEPEVIRAIEKWDPELIVVDEAHKAKTATAKRSKALHKLGKDRNTLLLSGTPITKNLLDLYSQYKIIDPNLWNGESWTKFRYRYGVWGGFSGYELIGYQNQQELIDKVAPYTLVARKKDTLDLPEKTHVVVPLELGKSSCDYQKMARDGVLGDWVTTNPLEKALRLSQITSAAKIDATVEFVEEMREQGEQVVVYARFRSTLKELEQRLGVDALTGDTPSHLRTVMVEDFQAGLSDVFLSQIVAGSTGITLTAASIIWYHELTYAYEDWAQSQDRIHRIGQDKPCTYYYATAVGKRGGKTIDGLIIDALTHKEDVAAQISSNPDMLLLEE